VKGLSLFWRVVLANTAAFMLAFVLLLVTPVEVSAPIRWNEVLILAVGLVVILVINLVLLRQAFGPLTALARELDDVDLRNPLHRIGESADYGAALRAFVDAFNAMLVRLAEERRSGARAALTAQERERLRIARALHDEAGQTLTAIALEIERAADGGPPAQREQMTALAAQLHSSLDEIRRITRELRPEALDDLGLVNALIALTSRASRQSGLRIERSISPELPALSTELELIVYRVAQEALTNVLRHAQATRCTLSLQPDDGGIELTVRDDGIGTPESLDASETIGIEGMRERALLGGGTLSIQSREGEGTEVKLRLPAEAVG
jgi:two-component system sensor histidine kinase UhpB